MPDLHDLPGPFTYRLTRLPNGDVELAVARKGEPVSIITFTADTARWLARDIWELTT